MNRAEETLKLIATLPAPEGLEDRVKAALAAAPRQEQVLGQARLLAWPVAVKPESSWLRAAAAAAIVFVVAGGGWGIYSRVQTAAQAGAKAAPQIRMAPAASGFSTAGAIRTPQTLNGPAVPVVAKTTAKPAQTAPQKGKAAKKKAAKPAAGKAASSY